MTNDPPVLEDVLGLMDEADTGVRRLSDLDDQIVVWVVGISAAALALIVGHFDEATSIPGIVKTASVLLGLCVACGIAHRTVFRQIARRGQVSLLLAKTTFKSEKMAHDMIKAYGDTPRLRQALEKLVQDLGGDPGAKPSEGPRRNVSKILVSLSQWLFHTCLLLFVVAGALLVWSLVLIR